MILVEADSSIDSSWTFIREGPTHVETTVEGAGAWNLSKRRRKRYRDSLQTEIGGDQIATESTSVGSHTRMDDGPRFAHA